MLEHWNALSHAARREIMLDGGITAGVFLFLVALLLIQEAPNARRDFGLAAVAVILFLLYWPAAYGLQLGSLGDLL
jgi:type IV secretory pathway TrbD component